VAGYASGPAAAGLGEITGGTAPSAAGDALPEAPLPVWPPLPMWRRLSISGWRSIEQPNAPEHARQSIDTSSAARTAADYHAASSKLQRVWASVLGCFHLHCTTSSPWPPCAGRCSALRASSR